MKKTKIAIVLLSVLSFAGIGVSVGMGIAFAKERSYKDEYRSRMDTAYTQNFYELMDNMNDIETKLSKLPALTSSKMQCEYLNEIWRECSVAVSDIGLLDTEKEQIDAIMKFLNQTGDYCGYLAKKTADRSLTETELTNINTFLSLIQPLNQQLFDIHSEMVTEEKLNTSLLSDLASVGKSVKTGSDIDYPELIYDGPFSDGLRERKAKFLSDKADITAEDGVAKIMSYFPEATSVSKIGENHSSIPAYLYSFSIGERECTAQITVQGGYVSEFSAFGEARDTALTEEQYQEKGEAFLRQIGYDGMRCVWYYNADSTVYLNFAYVNQGVICYADLIKLKINGETGEILGLEAQNYMYNHTVRTIDFTQNATVQPSEKLSVKTLRDCLIPTEWGTEIYCREVCGTYNGSTYYLYYDLSTGEEVKALIVVDELPS